MMIVFYPRKTTILHFKVNEQTTHYLPCHYIKCINLLMLFLLYLYDAL